MLFLSSLTLAVVIFSGNADAHGKMVAPKPTCRSASCTNAFSGTVDGPSALTPPAGMSFKLQAKLNREAYTAAFKAQTKYKSLLDLVHATQVLESGASQECGFSLVNGTAQPLPDKFVEWTKLPSSHQGPCEIWCDDKLAFSDENCAINYPDAPASFPYDKSKCVGAKMLKSVWMALHLPIWQVYLYCAPLIETAGSADSDADSDVGSDASSGSGSTSTATLPPPAAASGSTSVAGDADSASSMPSPSPASPAPAAASSPSTPAPSATMSAPGSSSPSMSVPTPTNSKPAKCKV